MFQNGFQSQFKLQLLSQQQQDEEQFSWALQFQYISSSKNYVTTLNLRDEKYS